MSRRESQPAARPKNAPVHYDSDVPFEVGTEVRGVPPDKKRSRNQNGEITDSNGTSVNNAEYKVAFEGVEGRFPYEHDEVKKMVDAFAAWDEMNEKTEKKKKQTKKKNAAACKGNADKDESGSKVMEEEQVLLDTVQEQVRFHSTNGGVSFLFV